MKQTIRLTENELRNLINESVSEVLEDIDIDPKNKGKFTATQKKTGKSTEELCHSKNPLTRKRANFAKMAKRHWKPLKENFENGGIKRQILDVFCADMEFWFDDFEDVCESFDIDPNMFYNENGYMIDREEVAKYLIDNTDITYEKLAEKYDIPYDENYEVYESVIKNVVRRILSEDLFPTYKQIRNITGITDDDELNAAVESEDNEELESMIWNELKSMANGNPRETVYNFDDIAKMLNSKFGFEYIGPEDEHEAHVFRKGNKTLDIYPRIYYPKQGKIRIENYGVYNKW